VLRNDHISLFGFNFLLFDNINSKLYNLTGFDGFTPRWTLITKLRNINDPTLNSTCVLLIIVIIIDYICYRILKER
jgi:hypothetical protein